MNDSSKKPASGILRQKEMNDSKNPQVKKKVKRVWFNLPMEQDLESKEETPDKSLSKDEEINIKSKEIIKETIENPVKNIDWITHGEFTVEGGRLHIEKFVSTWEHEPRWTHYTEFVERQDLGNGFNYIYHVYWCVPTGPIPIPPLSTPARFTLKFIKGKPPDEPVEVFYTFEEQALVHRPGMSRFRERWVRDILQEKYKMWHLPLD